jgi:hypothetical protein
MVRRLGQYRSRDATNKCETRSIGSLIYKILKLKKKKKKKNSGDAQKPALNLFAGHVLN